MLPISCTATERNHRTQLGRSCRRWEFPSCTFQRTFESWSILDCHPSDRSSAAHRSSTFPTACRSKTRNGGDRCPGAGPSLRRRSTLLLSRSRCRGCFQQAWKNFIFIKIATIGLKLSLCSFTSAQHNQIPIERIIDPEIISKHSPVMPFAIFRSLAWWSIWKLRIVWGFFFFILFNFKRLPGSVMQRV